MLRIHGHPASINVRKVLWLCAELEVTYELVERGTAAAPVSDPAYRTLNSAGLVPLLEDGEFRLPESNTILRYLARREGRRDLLPTDARAAARIERWIDWQATDLNDAWRYAFVARFRDAPGYDDPRRIERSLRAFDSKVSILDGQLAESSAWIADDDFTLADIVIGLSLRRWLAMEPDTRPMPRVMAYYDRLCARPTFLPFGGPESPP